MFMGANVMIGVILTFGIRFQILTGVYTHAHALRCFYGELLMEMPLNLYIEGVFGKSKPFIMIYEL